MAGLNELRSRFSLTEEEEGGAEVSHQVETVIHRLIAIPFFEFSCVTFWVQILNVLEKNLTSKTGEMIGKTIGSVVQVADTEDDGSVLDMSAFLTSAIDVAGSLTRDGFVACGFISGSARSQGPWGKKYQSASQSKSGHSNDNFLASSQGGCKGDSATAMDADQFVNAMVESKRPMDGRTCEKGQNVKDDNERHN
nr:hypothetical protein CFP56_14888 [Quercus suber]